MPDAVEYIMPVVPAQMDEGPVITGTGRGLTWIFMEAGLAALQPFEFV
jgi:hypothetical protein